MNDGELLRRSCEQGDEDAFDELVRRHLDLVHATALRRLGDPHAAADVSQAVFCLVWRKASRLYASADLTGWLHRATCFKAGEVLRAERRRRFHEQEAAAMHVGPAGNSDPWAEVAPHLDEALNRLGETERQLILWRYFRRVSLREVGDRLGVSEDAARMRVRRAVGQLRQQLARAGVAIGPSVLAELLEGLTIQSAPVALRDDIVRRVRELPLPLPASSPLVRIAGQARSLVGRPIALGIASMVLVGTMALWWAVGWPAGDRAPGPEAAVTQLPGAGPSSAALPIARTTSVVPRPLSAAEIETLLADLRRILGSPVQDNVWPPEDLRRSILALSRHPGETLALLQGSFHEPTSSQMTRERAIWGLWLLGEAAPSTLSAIVSELTGVIQSPEEAQFWWHAASVLRHLGTPESSLAGVAGAVERNPASAVATLDFWESAANRYPQATEGWLRPWLGDNGAKRFVAARILARMPGVDRSGLLPIVEAGLDEGPHQSHALAALKAFGPEAAELAPRLRTRLAEADRSGAVWLKQQLIEVLAAISPEAGVDLPEVDHARRVQQEADALKRQMEDDVATVAELAVGLRNPKICAEAAMTLEELGPAAAEALPALREALAEPGQSHRHYLAKAIKAIDPASPKPLIERDELLATLRALSEVAQELDANLEEAQRQRVAELIRDAGDDTPDELAEIARQLEAIHPRLRVVYVSGLQTLDPALEAALSR